MIFDAVLPLKISVQGRGSDLNRFSNGLLSSLVISGFYKKIATLYVICSQSDTPAISEVLAGFRNQINFELIDEIEILGGDFSTIAAPRKGWYIQQLIKLAMAERVKADYYLTLDADILVTPSFLDLIAEDGTPGIFHKEKRAIHAGWWDTSAALLEEPSVKEDLVMGVTPEFLNKTVATALLERLRYIAGLRKIDDWKKFLMNHATNTDSTWTEYTLYWTFALNNGYSAKKHHAGHLYSFCHSKGEAMAEILKARPSPAIVVQSSYVDDEQFRDVVSAFQQKFGTV